MHSYVRVAAAVPQLSVADCTYNIEEIIKITKDAFREGVHAIVFPELCITGYTCGDLFFQMPLIDASERALKKLLNETAEMDIIIVAGLPVYADNQTFNCAVITHKGRIMGIIPKTYLPNSSEFYEERWFSSTADLIAEEISLCGQTVPMGSDILFDCGTENGLIIGVEICQDLWCPIPPSSYQALGGANLILNLSASNEVFSKQDIRRSLVKGQSSSTVAAYVYSSSGIYESTTDTVFSGHCLICENGIVLSESERFEQISYFISRDIDIEMLMMLRRKNNNFMEYIRTNGLKPFRHINIPQNTGMPETLQRDIAQNPFLPLDPILADKSCMDVFNIQHLGLTQRLRYVGAKKSVLAVSGGLDSTMALLVTAQTHDFMGLDRKSIIGITMPGFGTTDRTYQNGMKLMEALGITIREIDIKDACIQHFKDIGHDKNVHDTTFENAQSRERIQIAMDIANMEKGLVVGTGDLSELALGFTTYGGDHLSMYNVNGGLPKTLIRVMIQWVANHNIFGEQVSAIIKDILDTPVSPELLPPGAEDEIIQKTEELVGPYELNDFFLYYMVNYGFSPRKIVFMAENSFKGRYTRKECIQWLRKFYIRFFTQQYKRSCMADGPKAVEIGLSPRGDWKMPSDASYNVWIEELDMLEKE